MIQRHVLIIGLLSIQLLVVCTVALSQNVSGVDTDVALGEKPSGEAVVIEADNRGEVSELINDIYPMELLSHQDMGVISLLTKDRKQLINVLIVTGMDHPAHNWRETTPALKEVLLKDSRMTIDILEDPYQLGAIELDEYDVVFLHFNNWEEPDPGEEAQENLKQFVANGGGLALLHFASGAFRNWDEFPNLAGKIWDGVNTHDPYGEFHVELVNDHHPITENMESFDTVDELYIGVEGDRDVELLAHARSTITNRYHPMAFVHNYEEGRVFHTPLGHDVKAIRNAETAELIRRGVAWTAGYEIK